MFKRKKMENKVTLEEAPQELSRNQKKRWVAYKNRSPAFSMWRSRMKRASLYIRDEQYIFDGYDVWDSKND